MKLKGILSAIVIGAFVIGGCSDYNKTKVKDHNEGNERIYGEKGAPPKQMANKYEANPESPARAMKVRDKLYPKK